ncbi:uncharacterized protein C1orf159 homolog isoform X2 [Eulemur rufifrons]|uniref:uncharacterized protein C1orf159 homolog isoform X2 n=1 Tax=Eulemur rufifrons TaxID=859984 RepID=UPI0037446050
MCFYPQGPMSQGRGGSLGRACVFSGWRLELSEEGGCPGSGGALREALPGTVPPAWPVPVALARTQCRVMSCGGDWSLQPPQPTPTAAPSCSGPTTVPAQNSQGGKVPTTEARRGAIPRPGLNRSVSVPSSEDPPGSDEAAAAEVGLESDAACGWVARSFRGPQGSAQAHELRPRRPLIPQGRPGPDVAGSHPGGAGPALLPRAWHCGASPSWLAFCWELPASPRKAWPRSPSAVWMWTWRTSMLPARAQVSVAQAAIGAGTRTGAPSASAAGTEPLRPTTAPSAEALPAGSRLSR